MRRRHCTAASEEGDLVVAGIADDFDQIKNQSHIAIPVIVAPEMQLAFPNRLPSDLITV